MRTRITKQIHRGKPTSHQTSPLVRRKIRNLNRLFSAKLLVRLSNLIDDSFPSPVSHSVQCRNSDNPFVCFHGDKRKNPMRVRRGRRNKEEEFPVGEEGGSCCANSTQRSPRYRRTLIEDTLGLYILYRCTGSSWPQGKAGADLSTLKHCQT